MSNEKKNNNTDKSFEAPSVHSDCSELNTAFSNMSSRDFDSTASSNAYQENFADDNNNDGIGSEVIVKLDECMPRISNHSTIRFADTQQVILVKHRDRKPDHRKMGHRQVPNPWRRFGAVKTLHKVGGWMQGRRQDQRTYHVEAGTPLLNEPKGCHLSLHQDPIALNQEFFKFKFPRSADSQAAAYSVGLQIADHCQTIQHARQQPPSKKSQSQRRRSFGFFGRY